MTTYQVVGQCAHVTVLGVDGGKQIQLLYKGSILPSSATEQQIKHLLSLNLIAAVGGEPVGTHEVGAVAGGTVRTGLDGDEVESVEPGIGKPLDPDADVTAGKRAAARAKLPEDGSAPDGRAGHDVWVEYLAARGYDYFELAKQEKSELVSLAKKAI